MPSQLTHLVFAVESIRNTFERPLVSLDSPFLGFGAQGPDIFYHNRRRKPSGLEYGALLHRRGYGTAVAALVRYALEKRIALDSDYGAYVAAFATHAPLDRTVHPFVNYFAGWGMHSGAAQPGAAQVDRASDQRALPFQLHAYFERVLDRLLLQRWWDRAPETFDFVAAFRCGETLPATVEEGLAAALAAVTDRAAADPHIRARLHNAYLDSLGFYRSTNLVDAGRMRALLRRVDDPRQLARWLSLIHPLQLPAEIDFANERHGRWYHPCGAAEQRTDSFWDLLAVAMRAACDILRALDRAWHGVIEPEELVEIVGEQNLSDGRHVGRPCRKRRCDPLPLAQLLRSIIDRR